MKQKLKNEKGCPSWINTANFWLGSANNTRGVWRVDGGIGSLYGISFRGDIDYGVRPVIEISKSLI